MNFNIDTLVRDNIKKMSPYSSARHEFSGEASIYLDANENSFGSPLSTATGIEGPQYNRYPDPLQNALKEKISRIKGVPPQHIFLGNGSDEAIDLLFRIFCEPGKDNVLLFPPTYGMYKVAAETNDVAIKEIPLLPDFQLDLESIEAAIDEHTKLIFICSPNNPTGNSIDRNDIELLLNNFNGLVVIDEAYINYSRQKTWIQELTEYPNLVILQTLSKAWGLAGLRLGMAFAGEPVIGYMNKVKYPYNINTASQQLAMEALENISGVNNWTKTTVQQREWLANELTQIPFIQTIYPSDANFLLVKMEQASNVYAHLAAKGIIVRDRSSVILCNDCLRITIGTPEENLQLVAALNVYQS
ncbi:MAG: histidinol-phosphate transaminase [Bacteroidetes bacterium]|nr:histidinol-phosphate transaminase [Bacteroidota bacterium]